MPPRRTNPPKLDEYRRKRNFGRTSEPAGGSPVESQGSLRFVIQKHAASHLHYDLRLEMEGVMKSWAVPKGPSLDPAVKRLAMEVEDHPIEYNTFEGTIPAGEYGGGTVMLWDQGTYEPEDVRRGETADRAAVRGYRAGKLSFTLHGERLRGSFGLVRTDSAEGGVRSKWLFFKHRDDVARPGSDVTAEITTSVVTDRSMGEIAEGVGGGRVWRSNRSQPASRAAEPAPAQLPELRPMLASSGIEVSGSGWSFEPKYDGIRVLAFAAENTVALITRNGHDKARQFPEITAALRDLVDELRTPVVLDGEIVALEGDRIARFEALQGRMHTRDARRIAAESETTPGAFIAFDLLLSGPEIHVAEPFRERRATLEELLEDRTTDRLRISPISSDRDALLRQGRREGWEGIIAKKLASRYQPGKRTGDWVKLKLENRQEFVVGGWTEPRGTRSLVGALLLGYYDDEGTFRYAGHTGTGFDEATLKEIHRLLKPLERKTSPFASKPKTNQPAHWTTPRVVVEVRFNEWTREGKLRQPVFLGIRDDKDPAEVRREPPAADASPHEDRLKADPASERSADHAIRGGRSDEGPSEETPSASDGRKGSSPRRRGPSRAEAGEQKQPAKHARGGSRTASATGKHSAKRGEGSGRPAGEKQRPSPSENAVVRKLGQLRDRGGGELELGRGAAISITSLDKVFYPETGHTKGDLLVYYARMRDYILPWMKDRPLVLKRFPNGVAGESFYQQAAPDAVPPGVRVETLDIEGKDQRRLVGGELATLLYTVQLGAISYDPWHSRIGHLDSADYTILDLDPGEGTDFRTVVDVALWVEEEMEQLGLHGALKTSGSRGLHVYLPLPAGTPLEAATLVAQIVATRVAQKHPEAATVERMTKNRPRGTVYVDYLQNILGKTVAGVYAVRARPAPTVSTPLEWSELTPRLDLLDFTIDTVPERVARIGDLWRAAMREPNSLERLTG